MRYAQFLKQGNGKMRIAIVTGGGDCPGINAAVQAIVRQANQYHYKVFGVMDGYAGLINDDIMPLTAKNVEDMYCTGGSMLRASRTNPTKTEEGIAKAVDTIKKNRINALIAMGGDDTLGAAYRLNQLGVNTIGIPKTVDNNLSETDICLGFQTAVDTAAEAISRLHSTAKSHNRVIIAEVMGRFEGWLTLMAGLAGGAHIILIPEKPFSVEEVCQVIKRRVEQGKGYTIIALAEGIKLKEESKFVTLSNKLDEFGQVRLGGIGCCLEKEIEKCTGKETRTMVLGHIQRGGDPSPYDIILGIRMGTYAVELIKQKKFGYGTALKGKEIVGVKLEDMIKQRKVSPDLFPLTDFFSP